MRDLFRRKPLREYPDYSSSHLQAGSAYQARFQDRPGRAAMWQLEKPVIERIFTALAPGRILDFATGTGRIAAELERCLPACEIHGIDISEDMLATARTKCSRVAFQALDGRQALQEFGPEAFDLVSAFRFFPNADPALREDVAEQIAELVRPGGHVVLNNHRNFWSPSYVAMRAMVSAAASSGHSTRICETCSCGGVSPACASTRSAYGHRPTTARCCCHGRSPAPSSASTYATFRGCTASATTPFSSSGKRPDQHHLPAHLYRPRRPGHARRVVVRRRRSTFRFSTWPTTE